ncbi:MAG: metabolite traffic protein EboE, partial [Phycisphaerae bacterium]
DWRTPQRRDYTRKLADILSQLLPEGVSGSISTVPGSYGRWVQSEEDVEAMCLMLCDVLMHLRRLRTRTGRDICLALEPEPDCFVETTEQVIEFLTGPMQRAAREFFKLQAGLEDEQADEILQRHLGVCFDCAHQAVQFEDLSRCLLQLRSSGVRIAKVHLSAAFEAAPSPEARKQLETFVEPVYLHQTKVERPGGEIVAYSDLPDALAGEDPQGRWRVHFHVPLFFESDGALGSTRRLLKGQFAQLLKSGFAEHLEIETYTFGVLPDNMAITDPADAIAREYQWVLGDLLALR